MATLTIAAHFKEGVILAADRRVLRGHTPSEEKKLYLIYDRKIVISFSGYVGIMDDILAELENKPIPKDAKKISDVINSLKKTINKNWDDYCKMNTITRKDDPIFEVIVCGLEHLDTGDPMLFRIQHNGYCERILRSKTQPYYVAGSEYAMSLMKLFYRSTLSREGSFDLFSHIILQTGLADTYVGGNPHIVYVEPNKLPIELEEKEIDDIVSRVNKFEATISQVLLGLYEDQEIYRVIQNYVLSDLGGVVKNNRNITITLERNNDLRSELISGTSIISYKAHNESRSSQLLFIVEGEDDVITKGTVTIPFLKRDQIPDDPKKIWNLSTVDKRADIAFMIDKDAIHLDPIIEWKDESDHSKGVKFRLSHHKMIEPDHELNVKLASKCQFSKNDYIVRRFMSYGKDAKVTIHKREDIEVNVNWFLTAKGKKPHGVTLEDPPRVTPTTFSQRLKGVLIPGNGFIVMWWDKKS